MSVHTTINRLATGTYTVTRYAAASDDGFGRKVPGATSTFPIVACVQPDNKGLSNMVGPEGQTGADIASVWTMTELRPTPGSQDEITFRGEQWKVFACELWEGLGGTSYRGWAARQKVP
jgi:hypothetical protein